MCRYRCFGIWMVLWIGLGVAACSDATSSNFCQDEDGDGRGVDCDLGTDCDDQDPDCAVGDCCLPPEAEALSFMIRYAGGMDADAVSLLTELNAPDHGLSLGHELRLIDGVETRVHSVFVGLRHKWFSAQSRPARRGNRAELLIAGEEAWSRVYQDLLAAEESILIGIMGRVRSR